MAAGTPIDAHGADHTAVWGGLSAPFAPSVFRSDRADSPRRGRRRTWKNPVTLSGGGAAGSAHRRIFQRQSGGNLLHILLAHGWGREYPPHFLSGNRAGACPLPDCGLPPQRAAALANSARNKLSPASCPLPSEQADSGFLPLPGGQNFVKKFFIKNK